MSNTKKIFIIISTLLTVFVVAFLVVINNIYKNIGIKIGKPVYINVYDHSITAISTTSYEPGSKEYDLVVNELQELTNISIFNRLKNNTSLDENIKQDNEQKYLRWDNQFRQENIVVELYYDEQQDVVVYCGDDTRVISYWCISYVIPTTDEFTDVIVYYSTLNESATAITESYAECDPLILYGEADNFKGLLQQLKKTN